jgi:hypothetical protein
MNGYKRALFRQNGHNPIVVLAISIYAIMWLAGCPANNRWAKWKLGDWTGSLSNRLSESDLGHFQTELSHVRLTLRKNISIDQPSPRDEHHLVVYSDLGLKEFRFFDVPYVTGQMSVRSNLKRDVVTFFSDEQIFIGVSRQEFCKKLLYSWSRWRVARILPNRGELPNPRCNRNECLDFRCGYLIESYIGALYRMQGLGIDFVRTVGSIGGVLHRTPLESGIVSVISDGGQSESVNDNRRPMPPEILPELLQAVGFLLFVAGFGLIYTVGFIKEETIFNVCQILCGVLLVAIGWTSEQAALNLMDFGRVDWRHLFF